MRVPVGDGLGVGGAWVRDSRDACPFAHHACPLWGRCATNGGMRVPVGDEVGGARVRDSRDASPFAHHVCPLWGRCATNGGMRVEPGVIETPGRGEVMNHDWVPEEDLQSSAAGICGDEEGERFARGRGGRVGELGPVSFNQPRIRSPFRQLFTGESEPDGSVFFGG
jgi:hypothetical protein